MINRVNFGATGIKIPESFDARDQNNAVTDEFCGKMSDLKSKIIQVRSKDSLYDCFALCKSKTKLYEYDTYVIETHSGDKQNRKEFDEDVRALASDIFGSKNVFYVPDSDDPRRDKKVNRRVASVLEAIGRVTPFSK